LMTDMLKEVVNSGTGKKLQSLDFPVAAKTGTSNIQGTDKNKDAWLVGCTADYVCTAWVGYDSGAPLPVGVSGGTYPAMMVESVFSEIYKNKEVKDFEMPEGIVKVLLDKKTLEFQKKPVIAGEFAGNSETVAEYFSFETMPKEYADLTSKAPPVKDFSVYIGENGFPIVTFKPMAQRKKEINYTIMRMGKDGQVPIYQTSEQKETVLFEDTSAQKEKSYRYYIVAMFDDEHAESEKIEVKLE
ncbi:MAG: hypothetical protein IJR47_00610, partial [Clostridia bacterium]|nr:hypothetical protein [Clostridia bacterium]